MTYSVTVTREGKWWMIAIPELDGLTQARRLSEAQQMAKEYIAVTRDIPIEDVAVDISISIENEENVLGLVEEIKTEREQAERLERDAAKKAERLARKLAADGVPLRDVGTILGVSHQRAHQLASA